MTFRPHVRRLVASLSLLRSGFDLKSILVRFMVGRVALGQVSRRVIRFFLSSLRECAVLIFMYELLVPEGQTDEAWEPSRKYCCFGNQGALDGK